MKYGLYDVETVRDYLFEAVTYGYILSIFKAKKALLNTYIYT
jgi:hypothetical protein